MNLSHTGSSEALETRNRSRDVAGSGLCTRCRADCHGNCEVFKSSFRGREVIYPVPFGEMTAGGDKEYPVDYSHLNILGYALRREGHRRGQPRQGHLPRGGHHHGLRPHASGAHAHAHLHRRTGLHRHRPQALGQLRHRRGHLGHLRSWSARTSAASTPRLEFDQERRHPPLARDGAAGQALQGVAGGLRRHHRPAQRRGHAPRRGRVRGREAGRRDDRAEVGPGRQVHRRRDQDPRPRRAPSSCRSAATSSPRTRPTLAWSGRSRAAGSRSSSAIRASASSTRRSSCAPSEYLRRTVGVKRVTLKTGAYGYPRAGTWRSSGPPRRASTW